MYTIGDILDALGEEVMLRSRDGGGENLAEDGERRATNQFRSTVIDDRRNTNGQGALESPRRKRQVASLVEVQAVWVGGHTHLLGWLDFI